MVVLGEVVQEPMPKAVDIKVGRLEQEDQVAERRVVV
jgi:hypothetical protein